MKLEDLKKLCGKATPGPWSYAPPVVDDPQFENAIRAGQFQLVLTDYDASFIAAARTYLPKLIAVAEAAKSLPIHAWGDLACEEREQMFKALAAMEAD